MRASSRSSLAGARIARDLTSGVSLLSRFPMPAHRHSGAESAWAWPLVGALIGVVTVLGVWACQTIGLSPPVTAALALALGALCTGALHEDGLADTADGLLGGRTPERRLEIMKDSRIGSYGALALILVLLVQWSALGDLLQRGEACSALIAAACLSRLPMVTLMAVLPSARPSGLSASAGHPSAGVATLAAALALLLAGFLLGIRLFPVLLGVVVVTLALGFAARKLIRGQSGDILGASQQLSFAAVLSLV